MFIIGQIVAKNATFFLFFLQWRHQLRECNLFLERIKMIPLMNLIHYFLKWKNSYSTKMVSWNGKKLLGKCKNLHFENISSGKISCPV